MKSQWQEVRDFLKKQLNRGDIESQDRLHIERTLAFLEKENNRGNEDWKLFVKRINSKLKDWKKEFPVDGYDYSVREYESNGFRSLTVSLEGKTYSTWLVEVESFKRPQNEIYISTIQSTVDEESISNLNDVDTYIEEMFKSDSFKEMVKFVKSHL